MIYDLPKPKDLKAANMDNYSPIPYTSHLFEHVVVDASTSTTQD